MTTQSQMMMRCFVATVAFSLSTATVASAQTQAPPLALEILKRIRFDLPAPTVRSLSLGGTGIGMPDDAGAVMSNPAALRLISRGEIVGAYGFHEASVSEIRN